MHAILFRKLEIDGVNYYQLYGENRDFKEDDTFADFANRSSKDFFYVDADSDIEITDPTLLNIYYDVDGEFKALNDFSLFEKYLKNFVKNLILVFTELNQFKK